MFYLFRNCISESPFVGEIADSMFPNIDGYSWRDDLSFLSTMRALLPSRMGTDDKIRLTFCDTNVDAYAKDAINNIDFVRGISSDNGYRGDGLENALIVHNVVGTSEKMDLAFSAISSLFSDVFEGYQKVEKVSAFYQKFFRVICFVNVEKKNTVLYVENLDNRKLHYLQVSIVVFLPWYINKDNKLTEDEMTLVKSLSKSQPNTYTEYLGKIASAYDFRAARIRKYLDGYEKRIEERMIEEQRATVSDIDCRINDLTDELSRYFRELEDANIRLIGLEEKSRSGDGEDSEFMEYFRCNKALDVHRVIGDKIYFTVTGYLDYFDRACAERTINNKNSFVHSDAPSKEKDRDMTMLLNEIFVNPNPRLKIKVCAEYMINIVDRQCDAVKGCSFTTIAPDHMPNPHINNYRCIGNYRIPISDALRRNDYIGAVEQCVASCSSLNWTDGVVMGSFMREQMFSSKNKFIELPDGASVNVDGAIEWLKSQEAGEVEKKEEKENE